mmetsp:Transcript_18326/g.17448  ORF Transcript_18326/g.17448 Transcript_18326/m.17448 type:complete len:99 (-) Transcript_18326:58-354(-)
MRTTIALLFVSLFFAAFYAQDCLNARILGATWGSADVTSDVAHSYNIGERTVQASTTAFGDPAPEGNKTLTVVYEICQNVATVVAFQGASITIPAPTY